MATATPITNRDEFKAATAEPSKFVSIYVHEGPVPDEVRQRFEEKAPAYADKVAHYKFDLTVHPPEVCF